MTVVVETVEVPLLTVTPFEGGVSGAVEMGSCVVIVDVEGAGGVLVGVAGVDVGTTGVLDVGVDGVLVGVVELGVVTGVEVGVLVGVGGRTTGGGTQPRGFTCVAMTVQTGLLPYVTRPEQPEYWSV